jgi:hypothetical protein
MAIEAVVHATGWEEYALMRGIVKLFISFPFVICHFPFSI